MDEPVIMAAARTSSQKLSLRRPTAWWGDDQAAAFTTPHSRGQHAAAAHGQQVRVSCRMVYGRSPPPEGVGPTSWQSSPVHVVVLLLCRPHQPAVLIVRGAGPDPCGGG